MPFVIVGPLGIGDNRPAYYNPAGRDKEGYRTYKVVFLLRGSWIDGPATALLTPGLPVPGSVYSFPGDLDPWCYCQMDCTISPVPTKNKQNPTRHYEIEFTYTNKPPDLKRCQEQQIDDPLLMPPKVSGSFQKYTEETTVDRHGFPIRNSAHEQIRGPQVEFDKNRLSIEIEQNVATFDEAVSLPQLLMDTVNSVVLWGAPRRCVKLSNGTFDRKFYGTCSKYYVRKLNFDVNLDTFDRDVLDEGTKVLNGAWNPSTGAWDLINIGGSIPNPRNPSHFIKSIDRQGNPCKIVLNGAGLPAQVSVTTTNWFVSIQSVNLNHPLTDETWWIWVSSELIYVNDELVTPTGALEWRPAANYVAGNVVIRTAAGVPTPYVAKKASWNNDPVGLFDWVALPMGGVTDQGLYNAATTYALGDYVQHKDITLVGSKHVEKYQEADLLILGVPSIL